MESTPKAKVSDSNVAGPQRSESFLGQWRGPPSRASGSDWPSVEVVADDEAARQPVPACLRPAGGSAKSPEGVVEES